MAALVCEICGGKLVGKPGGVFECDSCGMEFSTEWAKAKIQEIKGTVQVEGTVEVQGTVQVEGSANKDSLLKRGYMELADGDEVTADECFNQVLNIDPECAEAYLGLLYTEFGFRTAADIAAYQGNLEEIESSSDWKKTMQFGGEALRSELEGYLAVARKARAETVHRLAQCRERLGKVAGCISAGYSYTVGLRAKGTVMTTDKGCDVSGWRDIVAVATGSFHTVGIRTDGTVATTDKYKDVSEWRDMVAVAAGYKHTVGLRADGTVMAVGADSYEARDMSAWRDIVAVAAGDNRTVGLRADGTVVSRWVYESSKWRDIVAVAAGGLNTVGLRADGTVVSTDKYHNVSNWRDIVAVAAGGFHAVGLRADGTVVTTDKDYDVSGWHDMVAVAAGNKHIVGLRADGTVVATGENKDGQCQVSKWKLFNSIDTLEQERNAAKERACKAKEEAKRKAKAKAERMDKAKAERKAREKVEREAERARRREELMDERRTLRTELVHLKGLFTGKRRKEIEARLAEIDAELNAL